MLTLKSGAAAPVRAGDEVVGLFFEGQGQLEYQSVDPIEFPILAFNARKATSLDVQRTDAAATIRDGFERVLWLAAGEPPPELTGSAGPALDAAFARHLEKFRRARGLTVSHFFAQQRLDAPKAPRVLGAIDGGKQDLVYVLDGARVPVGEPDRAAQGLVSRRGDEQVPLPDVLSDQPVGRDRREDPLPPPVPADERRARR